MKVLLQKYHRTVFYSVWLLLQFIQGFNTELFDDEAYYWLYSKFPAWGYFDHPPMIAVLIKAGYALFKNELGVRLFPIILTTASLFVTEDLIAKKNSYLFYAICLSLALAQIGGMIAAPDTPLLFFVACFFLAYKKFNEQMSVANTLLLGLLIALMFYTKYQALLIVLFTAASNVKLFKHYQTYIAGLFALLLFIPHLYWQYNNGYPSLIFHLFERSAPQYDPWHSVAYIIGQLLIAGPLTGWLLMIAAFCYKTTSPLERGLKFSLIGFYFFFLASTLRGNAEANWTIPAFIGLIVLSHQYLLTNNKLRHLLYISLPVTLMLVAAARIVMMAEVAPAWWIFKDEFHGNKPFAIQVRLLAKNDPVVFVDTYQKPSKYWFYSADTAFGLNTTTYRRNNFNYWPVEEKYIGRAAFVSGDGFIPNYYSFSKVQISDINAIADGDRLTLTFVTKAPQHYLKFFSSHPYDTASIYIAVYKNNDLLKYISTGIKIKSISDSLQRHQCSFHFKTPKSNVTYKLAISTCLSGRPSVNSSRFTIAR